MFITTFYMGQNPEDFLTFLENEKLDITVLSQVDFAFNTVKILPNNLPAMDDKYNALSNYLKSTNINPSEEIIFLDWDHILYSRKRISDYLSELKLINSGVYLIEEPVKIQDYRLPPYMESLLMIVDSLKLDSKRLFESNPKVLVAKVVKGSASDVIKTCDAIWEKRTALGLSSLTAGLPIINSLFYVVKS